MLRTIYIVPRVQAGLQKNLSLEWALLTAEVAGSLSARRRWRRTAAEWWGDLLPRRPFSTSEANRLVL